MRKILLASIISGLFSVAYGQQDPQFTQNMFNRLFYNPAYAGSNGAVCGTAIHRQQYTGFEGTPVTTVVSVETNFNFPALYMKESGVGLTVMSDELGFENTFAAKLAYAHRIKPNFLPGFFRIGIEGGILNKSFDGNFVARDDPTLDPAILNASDLIADFGFGAYYHTKKLYLGISSTHLAEPTFEDTDENKSFNYSMDRHLYFTGGYYYPLNTPTDMELQPSFLAKSSLEATTVDVNLNFLYDKTFWVGFSLRPEDATFPGSVSALAGIDLQGLENAPPGTEGFKLGLAYDFGLSDLGAETGGSFELMLNYCYKIIQPPKRQIYKTIKRL